MRQSNVLGVRGVRRQSLCAEKPHLSKECIIAACQTFNLFCVNFWSFVAVSFSRDVLNLRLYVECVKIVFFSVVNAPI